MNKEINEKIERELKELTVDYPSEDKINQTIFALYEHVPERKRTLSDFVDQIKELVILSGKELVHISPYFWIVNLLFLFLGIVSTFTFHSDPYMTLFILSPLPFLAGLLEIFKSRDQGMAELEATLKYTVQQLIFSRMFIVSGFNLIVNVIIITWFYLSMDVVFQTSHLLIYWIMPLNSISALGLFITVRYRGAIASPILVSTWLIFGCFITQFSNSNDFIQSINLTEIGRAHV